MQEVSAHLRRNPSPGRCLLLPTSVGNGNEDVRRVSSHIAAITSPVGMRQPHDGSLLINVSVPVRYLEKLHIQPLKPVHLEA